MTPSGSRRLAAALGLTLAGAAIAGGPVPASIVLRQGDVVLDDRVVVSVNTPFTNGDGAVGFVVGFEDARTGIWYDDRVVFFSEDAPVELLANAEGTMGVSDAGDWIYSPECGGDDCVFGFGGVIAAEDSQAPDSPPGFETMFHDRPRMTDGGAAYWMSGLDNGVGGFVTATYVVYRRAQDGTITIVLREGDEIGNTTIERILPDYAVSGNDAHTMFIFEKPGSVSEETGHLMVDGVVVAKEGSSTGRGDSWRLFEACSINDSGDYVFSGRTDRPTPSGQFIAYNGDIVLRAGVPTTGPVTANFALDAISLNNLGQVAFIWDLEDPGGDVETLFYASDAGDIPGTLVSLLSVGQGIDTDGDNAADWFVADFRASLALGPGLDLAEDGNVYLEVGLDAPDGSTTNIDAIIRLELPAACSPADLAEPFGQLDFSDVVAFLTAFGAMAPGSDLAVPYGAWDFSDVVRFLTLFADGCP